jgi:hypothetical protein
MWPLENPEEERKRGKEADIVKTKARRKFERLLRSLELE